MSAKPVTHHREGKARRKAVRPVRKQRSETSAGTARVAPAGSKISAARLMARGWFNPEKWRLPA
jgi:hypothetical protein